MKQIKLSALIGICLVLVLAALPFMTACRAPAPTAPPAEEKEATPAPEKPIELIYSTWTSTKSLTNQNYVMPFMRLLEERTGGRVIIKDHYGGALGKAKEHYNMLRKGIIDISFFAPTYSPGLFPKMSVIELPFLVPGDVRLMSKVLWELYKRGALDDEVYEHLVLLNLNTVNPYNILTRKKKVTTWEDLKGLKMRVSGGTLIKTAEKLGCTPVSLPGAEFNPAMAKGLVDGGFGGYHHLTTYSLQELVKYIAEINVSTIPMGIAMDKSRFEKLPQDIQQVFLDVAEEKAYWHAETYYRQIEKMQKEVMPHYGIEGYVFPSSEIKRGIEMTKPIWDEWLKDMASKGINGQALIEEVRSILKDEGVSVQW